MDLIQKNYALKEWTSWKVGGAADYFAAPKDVAELRSALTWAATQALPVTFLGGGSNVLVSDKGVRGLVLASRELKGISSKIENDHLLIEAFCGSQKFELMRAFMAHQLAPAVFLSGLPGEVAGGVAMNAGVGEDRTPREFCEITDWVEVVRTSPPFATERIPSSKLQWGYRSCEGWQPGFIFRVGFKWPLKKDPEVLNQVRTANQNRIDRQPLDWPTGGSTFRNPLPQKAGQLIEQCGLKGFQIGGAQISEKHANFIINKGAATALDIHRVISHAREQVQLKTGVLLATEVVFLGEW